MYSDERYESAATQPNNFGCCENVSFHHSSEHITASTHEEAKLAAF